MHRYAAVAEHLHEWIEDVSEQLDYVSTFHWTTTESFEVPAHTQTLFLSLFLCNDDE